MTQKQHVFTPPVIALVLLSFVLGTSEFIVVGILPDISANLNISISTAGTLVTVFAIAYAIGTPFVTGSTGNVRRYSLLFIMNVIFILGNIASGLANSFVLLMLLRIVTAVASGTLISLAMTFTSDVSAPEHRATVVSWVFSGFSIASIVGVPVGTFLSHALGWRAAFIAIGIFSIFVTAFLCYTLPKQGTVENTNMKQHLIFLKDTRILLGLCIVLFGAGASYVFYTYLTPILETKLGVPSQQVGIALLVFGVCSIVSNLLSGKIAAAGGMKKLPPVFMVQALLLILLPFTFSFHPAGIAVVFGLGAVMYLMNSPNQLHFLDTAAQDYPGSVGLASSLNSVSFNVGIALGSLVGSLIVNSTGLDHLGWFGALFSIAALISVLALNKKEAVSQ